MERTLHRDAYLSPDFWRREVEAIFCRQWVCAGRAEEVPHPGDYLRLELAGESLLLVRNRSGELKAFFNVCRHRGCQLVPEGQTRPQGEPVACGHFRGGIRCPYHSWNYTLEGDLKAAPFLDHEDTAGLSLYPVGVAQWGGFVFLHLEPSSAEPLEKQLGAVPQRLQRYPLEELRIGRRLIYPVAANWKVICENYNECYHCAGVHPELCRVVPAFKAGGGSDLDWERGVPHREGAWTFTHSGTTNRAPFAGLNEDELIRHKGELLYPNFMVSLSADHVAAFTLWAQGPEHTTVVCDFLFHPDEMARPDFDPSDAVEFWDLVNGQDWRICEAVQRGMNSRVFERGYYAPMESWSLDIRRYLKERLGEL